MTRLDLPDPERDEDAGRPRMRIVGVDELTRTYDCRVRGCERVATVNRGRYAYLCDQHRAERVRVERAEAALAPPNRYQEIVKTLLPIAKRLDTARRKAEPVARELAAAKRAWAEAIEELPV